MQVGTGTLIGTHIPHTTHLDVVNDRLQRCPLAGLRLLKRCGAGRGGAGRGAGHTASQVQGARSWLKKGSWEWILALMLHRLTVPRAAAAPACCSCSCCCCRVIGHVAAPPARLQPPSLALQLAWHGRCRSCCVAPLAAARSPAGAARWFAAARPPAGRPAGRIQQQHATTPQPLHSSTGSRGTLRQERGAPPAPPPPPKSIPPRTKEDHSSCSQRRRRRLAVVATCIPQGRPGSRRAARRLPAAAAQAGCQRLPCGAGSACQAATAAPRRVCRRGRGGVQARGP